MTVREIVSRLTKTGNGAANVDEVPVTIIEPAKGWIPLKLSELWEYRDLFYFLVWRDVKARYAQSILGVGWAIIQPVFSMIVFTVVFGKLAKVNSEGVPYAIFSYAALVSWTYFSGALTRASGSLISSSMAQHSRGR